MTTYWGNAVLAPCQSKNSAAVRIDPHHLRLKDMGRRSMPVRVASALLLAAVVHAAAPEPNEPVRLETEPLRRPHRTREMTVPDHLEHRSGRSRTNLRQRKVAFTNADAALVSVSQDLSEYIQATLADTGIPSISIALMKDDEIVWQQAFGNSNATLQVPATSDTVYAVASCFKPVTAMAVMQLIDKGLVQLDDPVNKHLGEHGIKDLSEAGKPVTIRHILSHYSGLSVSTQLVPLWERKLPKTMEEHVAELKPVRDPGVKYEYSNSGYTVAGLLVEKVTGQTFEQYVAENILKPAGCKTRGPVHPTPEMLEQLARPYKIVNRKPVPEVPYRLDVVPAGDIYLTVPDLARILIPHINEGLSGTTRLLSKSSLQDMRTPQFGGKDGLDFGIRKTDRELFVMHGGGVPGYSSKILLATRSGYGVCIASNAGDQQLVVNTTACLAMDLLRGKGAGGELTQKVVHVGINFRQDKDTGLLRIGTVFPNSPASGAGLSVGTLIRKINQTSVKGKSLGECLALMKGPQGTALTFELFEPIQDITREVVLKKQEFLAPA
ncbi:MAG: serine hydrolase [Planctomycetales bacterium]|nr:serine hydrolase [Planctomycetales bacterium]